MRRCGLMRFGLHVLAAVDGVDLAGDESGVGVGEELDDPGDLVGFTEAPGGDLGDDLLEGRLGNGVAVGIIAAIAIVILLLFRGIPRATTEISNVGELQQAIQSLFAGVLLVVLGLELMETLRNYFIEHRLRVELLICVALIAVARHVIQLDYEHSDPWRVVAIAFLVLSLAASYIGVRVLIRNERATRAEAATDA